MKILKLFKQNKMKFLKRNKKKKMNHLFFPNVSINSGRKYKASLEAPETSEGRRKV